MSKSGVTGTILQVVGAVLMAIPGPWQVIGALMVSAGAMQNANYQKRKARDKYNASLEDRQIMTMTYNGARSRVYGLASNVDGVLFHGTHGEHNKFYTLVVAIAGHEIESVEQVYFDNKPVSLNPGNGAVTSWPYARTSNASITSILPVEAGNTVTLIAPPLSVPVAYVTITGADQGVAYERQIECAVRSVDGAVVTLDIPPVQASEAVSTARVTYTYALASSYAYVRIFKGADDQDISGELRARGFSQITAAHRFAGIALMLVDLEYNEDVFPQGLPQMRALIKGYNKIYDPRTGTTGYTDNPALCIRDWSLYQFGGDCSADEIHEASFARAANDCDIVHTYVDSADNATTRKLYRLSYVAKLDQSPETHLNEMVEAMGGKWGWGGGQLMVRAGVWHGAVATVTPEWLSDKGGARTIVGAPGMEDLVNTYKISIVDQTQDYNMAELPALQPPAYLAADGVELAREIQMGGVSFGPQALHIAGVLLRDQREGLTFTASFNMRAWPLELFDVVSFSGVPPFPEGKLFEVRKWSHRPDGTVTITFKETGAYIYDPDAVFSASDQLPNSALPDPFAVPDITGLSVGSGTSALQMLSDGTIISRLRVSWDPVRDASVVNGGSVEIGVIDPRTGKERRITAEPEAGVEFVGPVDDGVTYAVRMRARNSMVRGDWTAVVRHTAAGKTEKPPKVDDFRIATLADGTRLLSGGYTASTKPLDFAGYRVRYLQGAGPYTWAQMRPFQTDDGFFTTLPIETNLLLAGLYTLAIVGVDTTGNESDEPNFISALLPNPRLGDAIEFSDEGDKGWSGERIDCVVDMVDGAQVLRAREQATWDTLPDNWAAWTRWVYDPVTSITYECDAVDFGASVAVLPVVNVDTNGVTTLEVSLSDNGTTWGPWAAIASTVTARYARVRVTVALPPGSSTGPGVTPVLVIRSLTVIYVGKVSSETGNDLATASLSGARRIAVGDIRLPSQITWAHVSRVSVALQNVGAGWTWTLIDKDGTQGPRIRIYNGSGALADALIDWTIEGIST